MLFFPICKINLGLSVIKKRSDGYHEISTVMYPVTRLCDTLEIVPADEFSLSQSGREIPCPMEQNICYKAYRLLKENFNIQPVAMHLHKNTPFGAGLGGGSADGSYVIRGINEVLKLGLKNDQMRTLASELGSDTAFFIDNEPAMASGRGEILSPCKVNLSGYHLVILKPEDINVSTSQAYSGVKISGKELPNLENININDWKTELENDFEDHIFQLYPRIKELKDFLKDKGAIYASMSGSGSAVFGIFNKKLDFSETLPQTFVHQELIF